MSMVGKFVRALAIAALLIPLAAFGSVAKPYVYTLIDDEYVTVVVHSNRELPNKRLDKVGEHGYSMVCGPTHGLQMDVFVEAKPGLVLLSPSVFEGKGDLDSVYWTVLDPEDPEGLVNGGFEVDAPEVGAREFAIDLDVDSNFDGVIDDADDPIEVSTGGYLSIGGVRELQFKLTGEYKIELGTFAFNYGSSAITLYLDPECTKKLERGRRYSSKDFNTHKAPGDGTWAVWAKGNSVSASAAAEWVEVVYHETVDPEEEPEPKDAKDEVRLTVIKVDVTIRAKDEVAEVSEEEEDRIGGFILYTESAKRCSHSKEESHFSARGTNALRRVTFRVDPSDTTTNLPFVVDFMRSDKSDGKLVKSVPGSLYDTIKTTDSNPRTVYFVASNSYPAAGLAGRDFFLHGSVMSKSLRDLAVVIRNDYTQAADTSRVTSVKMNLVPDYDRKDLAIDDEDIERAHNGDMFYWWINNDGDKADSGNCFVDEGTDIPDVGTNAKDGKVNMHTDLLDFFPLWMDVKNPLAMWNESKGRVNLSIRGTSVGFVFLENVNRMNARSYLGDDCADYIGKNEVYDTNVNLGKTGWWVFGSNEYDIDGKLPKTMLKKPDEAVMMCEARDNANNLMLALSYDGKTMLTAPMNCSFMSVLKMFHTVDVRGGSAKVSKGLEYPDSECNGQNAMFIHGFKVTQDSQKGWNSEMFKRLHQSGSKARFWGVTWCGDYGHNYFVFNTKGVHYHKDVEKAFEAGARLAEFVNGANGPKVDVLIAHSLGNMVASSAICLQKKGLETGKYFMLDAAVASEAYDASLFNDGSADSAALIPLEWRAYDPIAYSACWHELFDDKDARSKLTWKGLFGDISKRTQLYNYYSEGDEVFDITNAEIKVSTGAKDMGWFSYDDYSQYAWQKQEMFKGSLDPDGVELVELMEEFAWAGWGFDDGIFYDRQYGVEEIADAMRSESGRKAISEEIKVRPLFHHNPKKMFPGPKEFVDAEDSNSYIMKNRYKALAYAIPAISPAAGRVKLPARMCDNYLLEGDPDSWGRKASKWYEDGRWLHCDIKDMAYFYIKGCFDQIVNDGGLK